MWPGADPIFVIERVQGKIATIEAEMARELLCSIGKLSRM
jgi:hypothetical protein